MSTLYPTAPFVEARIAPLDSVLVTAPLPVVKEGGTYLLDCRIAPEERWIFSSSYEVTWLPEVGIPQWEIEVNIPTILLGGFRIPNLTQRGEGFDDVSTQSFNVMRLRGSFTDSSLLIGENKGSTKIDYPYAAITQHDSHRRKATDTILRSVLPKLPKQ